MPMFRRTQDSIQNAANQANNTAYKAGVLLDAVNRLVARAEKNGYIDIEVDVVDMPLMRGLVDKLKSWLHDIGLVEELEATQNNKITIRIKLK